MYKLTVVSGPNRGSTYPVKAGQVTIGRQSGNTITLSSSKISKQHCVLNIQEDVIQLQDSGSSNGTFVNGVLVKLKLLKPGDRIGVGEYVLELSKTVQTSHAVAPALQGFGNTMQFPGGKLGEWALLCPVGFRAVCLEWVKDCSLLKVRLRILKGRLSGTLNMTS